VQFGADIALPDLRHAIGKCERHQKTGDACAVHYVALASREQAMADFMARFPAGGLGQLNTATVKCFLSKRTISVSFFLTRYLLAPRKYRIAATLFYESCKLLGTRP
jgi:hypothetical protein